LDSVVVDAVAEAAGVPAAAVRRAVMLAGATGPVARAALTAGGPEAATEALATFRLTVGRPVRPMLAQSAPDVGAALDKLGAAPGGEDASGTAVAVDVKLDGIRIQVHRDGDDVRVFTRSLDDITERVPEIVAAVRALPARALVLDGEALVVGPDGVPRPFQETAARSATQGERSAAEEAELAASLELSPFFFDVLHADGRDLLDEPLRDRLAVLDDLLADAAGPLAVRRLVTDDAAAATAFFDAAVAEGQEGVVVKSLDAPYAAGRRGAGWVKVKPRHTLDLVVLAVERGSGRRSGWLSNIWLGARDPEGGFVMLGKTFKGMTDEMLAWQTQRFRELQTADEGYVVHVRPEQVVEIAFDGLQRSTRYPGGLALRFARVVRYRDDKTAAEADTIDTVRALARSLGGGTTEAPDTEG
ncbi:MAG: ATP-dependent DNA ligase, partial [Cellulosimicrobium funkei]